MGGICTGFPKVATQPLVLQRRDQMAFSKLNSVWPCNERTVCPVALVKITDLRSLKFEAALRRGGGGMKETSIGRCLVAHTDERLPTICAAV